MTSTKDGQFLRSTTGNVFKILISNNSFWINKFIFTVMSYLIVVLVGLDKAAGWTDVVLALSGLYPTERGLKIQVNIK